MAYRSNPFDFVFVEFLLFFLTIISYAFAYYFIWKIDSNTFHGDIKNFLDLIYCSFVTVTTVGYGDIYPNSSINKLLVISELILGLWFLVTIIPVAVADQSESIRHYRMTKEKVLKEIDKAVQEGTLGKVNSPIPESEKENKK